MRRLTRGVLLVIAATLLPYCGFTVLDSWTFQKQELLPEKTASPIPPTPTRGLIGRMEIGRLGVSVIVMEGASATTLRRAAGHISGTALPGEPGNIAISAHRDTFFRPLRNIRRNDNVTLTTPGGEYQYRVLSTRIVSPDDAAVLDRGETEILTLITCYPFYFIGPAPKRFIVRAERVT